MNIRFQTSLRQNRIVHHIREAVYAIYIDHFEYKIYCSIINISQIVGDVTLILAGTEPVVSMDPHGISY